MASETRRDFPRHSLRCYWPPCFTERRPFDRKSENQTYLDYIQAEQYLGEEITDDEEDDEDDDEYDDKDEDEDEAEVESEDKDGASSEDEVDEQSKSTDASNQMSDVRRFMKGMERDEDFLEDYDMVDEVANFCEKGKSHGPVPVLGKHVALLDERNIFGTIVDKKGHCRTNSEPLTWELLREKLKKQVIPI